MTGFSMNSPDYPFQILDPKTDHHDPDPEHHGAARLAEGRADLDLHLDRQDLAADEGLGHTVLPLTPPSPRAAGRGSPVPALPTGATAGASGRMFSDLSHRRVVLLGLVALAAVAAHAGHELPFYPGYYPQEIRIERFAPAAAVPPLRNGTLHAYVGGDPFAGGRLPAARHRGGVPRRLPGPARFNPASPVAEGRCAAAARAGRGLGRPARRPCRASLPDHALSRRLPAARRPRPGRAQARPRLRPRARPPVRAGGPVEELLADLAADLRGTRARPSRWPR